MPVINDAVIAAADATAAAETLESELGRQRLQWWWGFAVGTVQPKKSVSKKIQSLQSIYKLLKWDLLGSAAAAAAAAAVNKWAQIKLLPIGESKQQKKRE